jgi:phosphotransferase system, enzyme I, PtsP
VSSRLVLSFYIMKENIAVERADYHLKIVHEISDLVNQAVGLNTILNGVVNKISDSLHFDVVSVYIWDDNKRELLLRSTRGLNVDPGNPVSLKPDEGLTGLVYERRRTLIVMPASAHPRYKYFEEIGEEEFESFIGVPIILQNKCLGVLVGQTKEKRLINPAEETLFQIIASRLAGLLEVADRLDRVKPPSIIEHKTITYQGKGVSGGFAYGKAYIFRGLFQHAQADKRAVSPIRVEKSRLSKAFLSVEKDFKDLISHLKARGILSDSEIDIFKAHLLILKDSRFRNTIFEKLEGNKVSAEQAVVEGIESIAEHFEKLDDKYLRERAQDFRDIGEKILHDLMKSSGDEHLAYGISNGSIIVAHDLGPSFLAMLDKDTVSAIITEKGGETSHAVIIAKSFGIPAVVGVDNICNLLKPGDRLIVDGKTGFIFSNPDDSLISEYENNYRKQIKLKELIERDGAKADNDSFAIRLSANIAFPIDVEIAKQHKLKDVGLYRTEFSFAQFKKWPGVEEQVGIYESIAKHFEGYITIRTLDIGADKTVSYFDFPKEENPLLGLRAIRFSMEYLEHFREQIRSILLTAKKGHLIRILLPMISNIWEVETARSLVEEIGAEVGIIKSELPKLGVMMEVPGMLYQINDYRDLIDFVSVGTNDLIQYLLAVDRNSNVVGHLYSEFHPSVLRMLDDIYKHLASMGKETSICGEMAGTPAGALALVSLGYSNLSVSPSRAPVIKFLSKRIDKGLLGDVRSTILGERKLSDIKGYLSDVVESIDPALLEF